MRASSKPISPKARPRLIVMVKAPQAGRVKTRLGRGIGMAAAAIWYRHQLRRLFRTLRDPRWEVVLAVAPDRAMHARRWPAGFARVPQGGGDLGARMARLLRSAPPGPAIVIGSDIPGITRAHIARGFRALGRHDAVFGPAPDGGYWLIGLARRGRVPPGILKDVRWSGPHALADSERSLSGLSIAHVDLLADVDEAADLTRPRFRHDGPGRTC